MRALGSPMAYCRFLGQYSTRAHADGVMGYLRGYRMSLDEFRNSHWTGDCNDFANTIAEIGYRNGYPMGLLSMWPRRWQDRLSKDWHQAAVLCLVENREYLVFEFEEVIHWKGTLEEYAQSQGKTTLPLGGVLSWQPTRPNFIARFLDHLRSSPPLQEHRPAAPAPAPASIT